ncbi:asparagine synthase (glutamine-hydrolyzing) [Domibacillus mangrovi]|uniref:asparagine synthase (glutamine-hydrolyzing) n=1 Tax=Domibacillus mangrovi TaxID=1714354 RepID=A0A1Q5P8B6_9BACI|nr:asparagine synthase (glutamine-hydrolyzing) [Domibacillus mangrovi]OKL38391.1 asparagine synthase (glutamine-hydrolyzing) [Domibacillus mangrovi]
MCGFVGVFHHNQKTIFNDELIQKANHLIFHRGPDDEGYFNDNTVQFAFRRLSIIDTENGHQPLSYENERYWIIFNGEIYNYIELRNELIDFGYTFHTHSDTEVLLVAYCHWGRDAVEKLRGMFSFLIWDKHDEVLFGARDRFGIKPFYYSEQDGYCLFGSESKSFQAFLPQKEVDDRSFQHYLTFQYVPEPATMVTGIQKLEPGTCFTMRKNEPMYIERYWKPSFQPVMQAESEKIKAIQDVLYDSVKYHMRSDVPVGCFLSGGIDSSITTAIAKEMNPDLHAFSVGFKIDGYSEIDVAAETADKIGVHHHTYNITPEEFLQELPKIVWHMDDPLADAAAIPLYFVAREAKKHVTVVLSGEGADELFGGYNIYREPQALSVFRYVPDGLKPGMKEVFRKLPAGFKGRNYLLRGCTAIEERYVGNAKMFLEREKQQFMQHYNVNVPYTDITSPYYKDCYSSDDVEKMQYIDMQTWLRGDILLKADKMTMAHSLELRVPFLDKEVFDVARRLNTKDKTSNKTTKYLLRRAAEGIVPDHVLERKKLGFPVPIRVWLKNELYDWARTMIQESPVDHLMNKSYVHQLLDDHVEGIEDNSRKLWTLLIFMQWHKLFIEDSATKIEKEPLTVS